MSSAAAAALQLWMGPETRDSSLRHLGRKRNSYVLPDSNLHNRTPGIHLSGPGESILPAKHGCCASLNGNRLPEDDGSCLDITELIWGGGYDEVGVSCQQVRTK